MNERYYVTIAPKDIVLKASYTLRYLIEVFNGDNILDRANDYIKVLKHSNTYTEWEILKIEKG